MDLKKQILPSTEKLLADVRSELIQFMEGYFDQWDAFKASEGLEDKPGLHLRSLRHYIYHHSARTPCRQHAEHAFPCGLAQLRSRQSEFPQKQRVSLHAKEADLCLQLQSMSKLLDAYLFHRSANELQKPAMLRLLEEPPAKSVVVLSDFKELVTLPLRAVKSGEEFYATARKELSVFGSILAERKSDVDPTVLWTRVLIVSDVLDHTSCRASQCIDTVLKQRRGSGPADEIHLLSDAGPHFRSYEAMHHSCCVLPLAHKARVCVHWGVEKHFKSEADRLFALLARYIKDAQVKQHDLLDTDDLCDWVGKRASEARKLDPTSPFVVVIKDVEPQKKPAEDRYSLSVKHFHITRTYCVSSCPVTNARSRLGVRIYNHIFQICKQRLI